MTKFAAPDIRMETATTFPIVPDANGGPNRSRVGQLSRVLMPLGVAASWGLASPEAAVRADAEQTLLFLEGATKFLAELAPPDDWLHKEGYHCYSKAFTSGSTEALDAARAGVATAFPIERLSLQYLVEQELGTPHPVGAVAVTTAIANHPIYNAGYTRLAYSTDPEGKDCTLSVAVGTVTHDGMPVPDLYSSFSYAGALGDKLAAYPANSVNVIPPR